MLTVLGAGPGLGFYVPAAILARWIGRTRPVELLAIEALLPPEKQEIVRRSRVAFHRDFGVARMGQRLARDMTGELAADAVEALLSRWRRDRRRDFAVFSGFWAPLVARYARELGEGEVRIDCCHVDCVPSSSWSLVRDQPAGVRDIWFVHWEDRTLNYRLEVSGQPPLPWAARSGRLLVHGGGWGIGTYRERVGALDPGTWPLDILHYEAADLGETQPGTRQLMLDPDWSPWRANGAEDWFPPLGELGAAGAIRYSRSADYPPLFDLTRSAMAVVTKPGGGSLIDSLAAATPLVLVEPFGEYERKNGELWKELGFAVDLDEWVAGGCRSDVLERLHRNLLAARERTPLYAGPEVPA